MKLPWPIHHRLRGSAILDGVELHTAPAITTTGRGRDFGKTRVLHEVNLSVAKGRVCALLGSNGAGKSTLLKLLMGLIERTRGNATLLSHPCWPANRSVVSRTGCLLNCFDHRRTRVCVT